MCHSELQERYVNFYTDFAFKKLFGTEVNKGLLISFLNSLLEGEEEIIDLTYLNTEQLGANEQSRKAVFDVYCQTSTGERILVEMQKAEQQYFKDRSLYYSTFPIRDQGKKGDWNYCLKKVYAIGVLNFCIDDKDADRYRRRIKLIDDETHEVFYGKLTYIYIEMPKFTKTEDQLETLFDKWLYAIRHLATLMERPRALQEAVFTHLFEQAEIAKFNRQDLMNYEESLKDYRDMYSVMQTQHVKGIEIGKELGKEERNAEIIRRQLAKGKTAEEIADILDVTVEYVRNYI